MLKVERLHPSEVPGCDVFYPSIRSDPDGFYLGMEIDGLSPGHMRPAISVAGLRELARKEGMVDRAVHADVLAANAALRARLDRAEARVAELEKERSTIAGLARKDFEIRRKRGGARPKPAAKGGGK